MPGRQPNLCCDMLESTHLFPYSGWSSAYSVLTILIQLQSYLLDEGLIDAAGLPESEDEARRFQCPRCSHCPEAPFPVANLGCVPVVSVCRPVVRVAKKIAPTVEASQTKDGPTPASTTTEQQQQKKKQLLPPKNAAPAPWAKPKTCMDPSAAAFVPSSRKPASPAAKTTAVNATVAKAQPAPWSKVKHHSANPSFIPEVLAAPSDLIDGRLAQLDNNRFAALSEQSQKLRKRTAACHIDAKPPAPYIAEDGKLTKAQKKNLARKKTRQQRKEHSAVTTSSPSNEKQLAAENHDTEGAAAPLPNTAVVQTLPSGKALEQAVGLLDVPQRVLEESILSLLEPEHVGRLALSCSTLRRVCDTGYVWKEIFEQHCPASTLTAASLGDWKHCYLLEVAYMYTVHSLHPPHILHIYAEGNINISYSLLCTLIRSTRSWATCAASTRRPRTTRLCSASR